MKVTGAGRTDSGVHATGQVVSLETDAIFPFDRLLLALRSVLPSDLSVREAACVEAGFSARFSARERTYVYAILNRPERSALLARYAAHVPLSLNLEAMREAAAHLIGEHDFRSFAAAGSQERTVRRTPAHRARTAGRTAESGGRRRRFSPSHGANDRGHVAGVRCRAARAARARRRTRRARPCVGRNDGARTRPLSRRRAIRRWIRFVRRTAAAAKLAPMRRYDPYVPLEDVRKRDGKDVRDAERRL